MSLNRNELNPLSVLELRKLSFIPKHFSKITLVSPVDIRQLDHWINFNLSSRYSIKKTVSLDSSTQKVSDVIEIGIENPKEMLMLTLGCPILLRKN